MKIVTAKQMQELDSRTINDLGIPGVVLMERAGLGVVDAITYRFEDIENLRCTIVCGKGNNGGDGYVVARHLVNEGALVKVFLIGKQNEVKGDALINLRILKKLGVEVESVTNERSLEDCISYLSESDLIIDAIFGTGLTSPPRGLCELIIKAMNITGPPIFAVDIPSGLSSDVMEPIGLHVEADVTVTFGLPKIGNFFYPALKSVGELDLVDIGIPPAFIDEADIKLELLEQEMFIDAILEREPDAYKTKFGHTLVVGGSMGFTGAAVMAAEAAAIVGSGLTTIAIPGSLNGIIEAKTTEVMALPVAETMERALSANAINRIKPFSEKATCLAVGPGMGDTEETQKLIAAILTQIEKPIVLDADGLNCLSHHVEILEERKSLFEFNKAPLIITPHPGEMSRLTGKSIAEIQSDRIGISREFAEKYNVVVVLKGAHTLITMPDGMTYVNPTGNPGMASGGAGDVLTGIIAGLISVGLDIELAAALGVYVHGLSADVAMEDLGFLSIQATDYMSYLPGVLAALVDGSFGEDETDADHEHE